ncbi:MAG TPA: 50S ribosomal protein L6 [Candidatus Acidoferrales bacterium]|nr:50S ribosomal protein L6 [Candidatus Acidoferrales bacterium]
MSRIGKKPVPIPKGVTVQVTGNEVKVKGPKGEMSTVLHPDISIEVKPEEVVVRVNSDDNFHNALHGLWRANLNNMVNGTTRGYEKKLEIVGVGYRAEMKGTNIQMTLGFSHSILFKPPKGIKVETPSPTNIVVSGVDKQLVGQIAAKLRSFRPPEPYKGKGVKYEGEFIRRKAGKAAAAAK